MKWARSDLPGIGFAGLTAMALWCLPFLVEKANRIVPGLPRTCDELNASGRLWVMGLVVVAAVTRSAPLRFLFGVAAAALLCWQLGTVAQTLTPAGNLVIRMAPGAGWWLAVVGTLLLAVDGLSAARLSPGRRMALMMVILCVVIAGLRSGHWDQVSVLREYAANAERFANEWSRHVVLAGGSLLAAVVVGLPLGLVAHRHERTRTIVTALLSAVQTIPSIALFGVLMAPLAALAAAWPTLAALGIGGVGYAPALVALFLYALMPIVSNTVVGLDRVDPCVIDAASGMGLTPRQLLLRIRLPLALPTVLTGVRVVLVQNVGLAAIAALVGGGGLGTFIFQGIGQTAMDLVLLGALPTVALALMCGVVLDALVEWMQGVR